MKKPLVRLGLGLAVVALLVLWWQFGDDLKKRDPEAPPKEKSKASEAQKGPYRDPPATTKTPLDRHRWLRELERTINEGNKGGALMFRQKVAEDMTNLVKDKLLIGNLLGLIKEKGFGSDAMWQRDVLISMLRAIQHADATQMIRDGYYQARNDSERRVLLGAMARHYHDPEEAAVWAIDMALNNESSEMREFAYNSIELHSRNEDLIARTAIGIHNATTRREQARFMLNEIAKRSTGSPSAMKFVRERLKTPRSEELSILLRQVEGWGTEQDARWLESLATEFPEHGLSLREEAIKIRRMRQDPNADKERENLEKERIAYEEAREERRKEQERREKEAAARLKDD